MFNLKTPLQYLAEYRLIMKNRKYLRYLAMDAFKKESRAMIDNYTEQFVSEFVPGILKKGKKLKWTVVNILRKVDASQPEMAMIPDTSSYYINGIMTDLEKAKTECAGLVNTFNLPFTLIHNDTNGFIEDLLDCARMKISNKDDVIVEHLRKLWTRDVERGVKTIFVVGYSQGSIIACHAIDGLPKSVKDRCNIILLTFGSAMDELKKHRNLQAWHVIHNGDFVARIGARHYYESGIYGSLLEYAKNTHDHTEYLNTMTDHNIVPMIRSHLEMTLHGTN